jgi:DNA-binding response OmpR family regulator
MGRSAAKKRILVVEDEALIAWLLGDALERHGYVVVGPAATQSAALELVERERPQMAIVDVGLKEGDGISAAEQMIRSGVDVLFVTAHATDLVAECGLRTGVVSKPVDPDTVADAIRAVSHFMRTGEVPRWAPSALTIIQ